MKVKRVIDENFYFCNVLHRLNEYHEIPECTAIDAMNIRADLTESVADLLSEDDVAYPSDLRTVGAHKWVERMIRDPDCYARARVCLHEQKALAEVFDKLYKS